MFKRFGTKEPAESPYEAARKAKADAAIFDPMFSQSVQLGQGSTAIYYSECGAPDGHPVLYFYGEDGNRFVTAIWADLAVEYGLRLLCFDRPGRGRSGPLRPERWNFTSWA
ncbi:hypothetical protein BDK51DRAFT_32533, partial [Blyttiomyces helicus]